VTKSGARASGDRAPRQPDVRAYVDAYVERLKESGALRDPAAERAFRRAPRHLFVERFFLRDDGEKTWTTVEHDPERPRPEHLERIYSEKALITRLETTWAPARRRSRG
jgi:hypothetical protein